MYNTIKLTSQSCYLIKKATCTLHILWQCRTIITASLLCINWTNSVTSVPFYCNLSLPRSHFQKKSKEKKNKMHCLLIYSYFSKCPVSCWFQGWGSLTTAMAAIPPTQERMAWHLPELQGGNKFFWNGTAGIYKAERTHAGPHWDSFTLAC